MSDEVYNKKLKFANLTPEQQEFLLDVAHFTRKWSNPKIARDFLGVSPQRLDQIVKREAKHGK